VILKNEKRMLLNLEKAAGTTEHTEHTENEELTIISSFTSQVNEKVD
jgi:hypothetical protein